MTRRWSEKLQCSGCGMSFRSAIEEARHRHNFPALCRKPKAKSPRKNPDDAGGKRGS